MHEKTVVSVSSERIPESQSTQTSVLSVRNLKYHASCWQEKTYERFRRLDQVYFAASRLLAKVQQFYFVYVKLYIVTKGKFRETYIDDWEISLYVQAK